MQHRKGDDVGVLRLYLTPSALGAAQDDKGFATTMKDRLFQANKQSAKEGE